jgi:hypothetical protein
VPVAGRTAELGPAIGGRCRPQQRDGDKETNEYPGLAVHVVFHC